MKKFLCMSLVATSILSGASLSFADQGLESQNMMASPYNASNMVLAEVRLGENQKKVEELMVEDLLTDPRFAELDFDKESIVLFAKIQKMSDTEKNNLVSPKFQTRTNRSLYDEYGDIWGHLTSAEKKLVVLNPTFAAIAYNCVGTANGLTVEEYGASRVGDESDAFRHTVWNALMQKYIGGSYPAKYATAHEDYTSAELNVPSYNSNGDLDGYKLQDHTNMDLNNNSVGRSLVKWTEYFTISHETIVERVHGAIDDGSSYYFYSY